MPLSLDRPEGEPLEPYPGSLPLAADGIRRFPDASAVEIARHFDLTRLDSAFYADPYPVYHALLEHEPVKWLPSGTVLLTRHADLEAVYKDSATFSSDKTVEFLPKFGRTPLYEHHTTSLVFNDPPLHTRVRRILAGALNPRAVASMEGPVTALVDRLLDTMEARETVDLVEDFAAAIPVEVIGNLLVVPHEERGPLRDWSLAILGALEPQPTPAQLARGNAAVTEFLAYLEQLIADRRKRPLDPDTDVLTRLIRGEETGERLSEKELLHNCIFILNAGHETTTNLIANALVTLSEWPAERARLVAEPQLMRSAVEEFLRFESSNQLGNRMTRRECEIGGARIPAGTSITLLIGAANRDPAQFPAPDRLDLARQPNRHLAFASGPHQCVGLAVARLEGRIALSRFLARYPSYRLERLPIRGGRARFRGYVAVPARLR